MSAPMYFTRDQWLTLLKERGPLTREQMRRMLGTRPSGKSWAKLLIDGCIKAKLCDNPLSGRGCRNQVLAYEYVKHPETAKLRFPTKAETRRVYQALAKSGWQLVPIEPTPEMCSAGFLTHSGQFGISHPADAPGLVYKSMLAAAPTPRCTATADMFGVAKPSHIETSAEDTERLNAAFDPIFRGLCEGVNSEQE